MSAQQDNSEDILPSDLEKAQEACTATLLNFLECPTLDNQIAASSATTAYREAWIRSKSQ